MREVNVEQKVRAIVRKEVHVWRNACIIAGLWLAALIVIHWFA